ncbi:MAG: TIGR01841 family phasin, partial [Pseudomonadota bacterium]|nr:TIGR01841 family phasin [Pseudomonadota bacterium]
MEDSAKTVQDLVAAGSPEKRVETQTAILKDGYVTAIANTKDLSDIMTTSGGEALEIISKRVTDGLDEVTKMVATNYTSIHERFEWRPALVAGRCFLGSCRRPGGRLRSARRSNREGACHGHHIR